MTVAAYEAAVWAATTEKAFQAQVVALAQLHGWMVFHPRVMIMSASGFPDLTIVRRHRLAFVELKTMRGKVTPAQTAWHEALGKAAEFYLWRPSDWERITEVLA